MGRNLNADMVARQTLIDQLLPASVSLGNFSSLQP
jgi:hypothetical protein